MAQKPQLLLELEKKGIFWLIIGFLSFWIGALIFQITSRFLGMVILTWGQFWTLSATNLISCLVIYIFLKKNFWLSAAKYLAGMAMVGGITLTIYYIHHISLQFSQPIFLGYVLIIIMMGFFYDFKAVLTIGIIGAIFYSWLNWHFFREGTALELPLLILNYVYLFASMICVSYITHRSKGLITILLKERDRLEELRTQLEEAKATMEIKVEARTRELRELAGSLDLKIKEKTKELQEKIEELEKFHRLAVGRELRMIGLKEELEKLKKELKKQS